MHPSSSGSPRSCQILRPRRVMCKIVFLWELPGHPCLPPIWFWSHSFREDLLSPLPPVLMPPMQPRTDHRKAWRILESWHWDRLKSAGSIHHVMWSFPAKIWPNIAKTYHITWRPCWLLEPLKQVLSASRDVIISGQIYGSKLERVFTLGDGCWLPMKRTLLDSKPLRSREVVPNHVFEGEVSGEWRWQAWGRFGWRWLSWATGKVLGKPWRRLKNYQYQYWKAKR